MISSFFDITIGSVPIPLGVLTKMVRRDVVGALYHCVSDELVAHAAGRPVKTPRQFESDLDSLQRHFNVVSYDQAAAHRANGAPLPPRAVLLTIDDGFSNAYSVIRPILIKKGVPATFFVVTGTLDNRCMADTHRKALCYYRMAVARSGIEHILKSVNQRYPQAPMNFLEFLSWFEGLTFAHHNCLDALCELLDADVDAYLVDHRPYLSKEEVRKMSEEGFTIGAHSKSHRELWLLAGSADLDNEIAGSCEDVCNLTGKPFAPFSFPYQSNRISRSVLAGIRDCHPQVGLMFDSHGFRKDSPFMIARQCFDNPIGAPPAGSNLCLAMRHAYMSQLFWTLRGRGKIA